MQVVGAMGRAIQHCDYRPIWTVAGLVDPRALHSLTTTERCPLGMWRIPMLSFPMPVHPVVLRTCAGRGAHA